MFVNGQLHNGPFTWVDSHYGHSFSLMENGRPAEGCMFTEFCADGWKHHVDSLEEETDVSGL